MLAAIDEVMKDPSDGMLLRINNYRITRKDLATLQGTSWLNDVIVNAYLSLIVERNEKNPRLPKTFAFDTFFQSFLARAGSDLESMGNWARGKNILEYDILLLPVFVRGCHWCMIAVDVGAKLIKYMDSMANENEKCVRLVRDYLAHQKAKKNNVALNRDEWKIIHVIKESQQSNSYDCGVFALKYADFAARRAEVNFTESDMQYFRNRMFFEILNSTLLPTGYGGNPD